MTHLPTQTITEVADHLFAMVHGQGEGGVSNAAFLVAEGQVLLIDSTVCWSSADALAQRIQRHGPLQAVILTHKHIDHIGGSERFAALGIPVVAAAACLPSIREMQHRFSPDTAKRIMPQFKEAFETMRFPQLAELPDNLLPRYGGLARVFPAAHTPADLAIWFPTTRVLVCGDLGFFGVTPLAADGLISGWIAALDALMALEPLAVIPGHGPVGRMQDLLVLQGYFRTLGRLASEAVTQGWSLDEAYRHFDQRPVEAWLEPARHRINLERAMQEARGEISANQLLPWPASMDVPPAV